MFEWAIKRCSHKYGEIKDSGYQYCEYCGKAIVVPIVPCSHKWKTIKETKYLQWDSLKQIIYTQQCMICGELKNFIVKQEE
jgi:DNA-directed RNA polymerase subunit RPC12/RpoP